MIDVSELVKEFRWYFDTDCVKFQKSDLVGGMVSWLSPLYRKFIPNVGMISQLTNFRLSRTDDVDVKVWTLKEMYQSDKNGTIGEILHHIHSNPHLSNWQFRSTCILDVNSTNQSTVILSGNLSLTRGDITEVIVSDRVSLGIPTHKFEIRTGVYKCGLYTMYPHVTDTENSVHIVDNKLH
jgi:hypothetical protein